MQKAHKAHKKKILRVLDIPSLPRLKWDFGSLTQNEYTSQSTTIKTLIIKKVRMNNLNQEH